MSDLARLILEGNRLLLINEMIRNRVDPNQADENGETPLMLAIGLKQNEIAAALIEAGAQVNGQDEDGETALHRASAFGNAPAVAMLANAGALVDAKNQDGKTPAIIAAIMGHSDVCGALIKAGADAKAVDNKGRGMIHWAALRNDNAELIELLIEVGADTLSPDYSGMTPATLAASVGHAKSLGVINAAS